MKLRAFLIPSNLFCSPFTQAKRQITSQLYPPLVSLLNEKPLRDQNSSTFLLFPGRSRDPIIVLVCHPRYEAASKPSSYASLAIDHKDDIYKIRTSAPRARICHSTSPGLPKHSYSLGSEGWPTKQAFESPSGVGKGKGGMQYQDFTLSLGLVCSSRATLT